MERLILYTFFGCVDACLCIDFFLCFFKKRSEKVTTRIFLIGIYVILYALNYHISHSLIGGSIWFFYELMTFQVIFGFLICCIGFKGKILEHIIMFTIFYICEVVADTFYITTFILQGMVNHELILEQEFVLMAIQKFFTFLISKSYQKIFSKRNRKIEGKIFFSIIFLPIITISVCVYLYHMEIPDRIDRLVLGVAIPLLICCNVIVFFVVEKVSRLQYEHYELDMLKQKIEMERAYYDRLDEIEQKQTSVRHDIKHYISVMKTLAGEDRISEMKDLLNQFEEGMNKITAVKYSSNRILNALLSEKKAVALKKNVEIEYMIEPNVNMNFMSDLDVISLFGNLIDNAVRAESECTLDKKIIKVNLFESEGKFNVLYIRNHFLHVQKKGLAFISTKKDEAEQHGIGLKNVEHIVQKYGGVFTAESQEEKENIFEATVCLPKV